MNRFTKTILLITLIAGTLDILSAITHISINTGKFPSWIFKAIAGGVLGRERAMSGGWATGLLGFFIHYLITFLFTLFYFLIYPRVPLLWKNKYLSAIGLGWFVFVVMNYLVLPLCALPYSPPKFPGAFVGLVMLPIVIGLPVAIGASRYYGKNPPPRLQHQAL